MPKASFGGILGWRHVVEILTRPWRACPSMALTAHPKLITTALPAKDLSGFIYQRMLKRNWHKHQASVL